MAASARSIRSNAAPSSRPESKQRPPRPELHVVEGRGGTGLNANTVRRIVEWTRTRSAPLIHVVVAMAFLLATLLGTLMLRTQMVENSFEAAQIEQNISTLTQDVEDDQAELDALVASLPQKAKEMGMQPQTGSVSIDLSGYQPSEGGTQ